MKKLQNILLVAVILSLASCSAGGPVMNAKALVTKNEMGSKVGIAEKTVWLGLAFNVDLSITAAAKKGKITKIATVDTEVIPGFLSVTYRTIVTGTNDEPEPEKKKKKKRRSKKKRTRR
ncbi:MAG: hypothetical protein JKY48_15710 [Flavobacteriales bacterium]|nr:hypothetical protein [Flavobacteriales bacterium]